MKVTLITLAVICAVEFLAIILVTPLAKPMASSSVLVMWFINHIEIPPVNKILKKGDVHCYTKADIIKLCKKSGLKLERYEVRKGFRLHCVVSKRHKK